MILKLNFQEGDRVQKGEALAQIEDIDYRAERDRVQAQLEAAQWALKELQRGFRKQEIEQAKAEREETKAQLRKAEADYKRNAQLFQRNVIPKEDFDETYSQYVALRRRAERLQFAVELMEIGPRQERIEAARAQMKQAQAELRKAQWRLDNCTIRAPISGTILKKNAEEGNIVNPVAFNISFSLCEMANLADMEVELSIQERDVAKVFPKQKCEIRPLAYRQRTYQGYVSRLMPIADRAKGAIPVRVKISIPPEEEGVYLKPEMGALVSFLGKTDDAAPPSESGKTKPQAVSDDNG